MDPGGGGGLQGNGGPAGCTFGRRRVCLPVSQVAIKITATPTPSRMSTPAVDMVVLATPMSTPASATPPPAAAAAQVSLINKRQIVVVGGAGAARRHRCRAVLRRRAAADAGAATCPILRA